MTNFLKVPLLFWSEYPTILSEYLSFGISSSFFKGQPNSLLWAFKKYWNIQCFGLSAILANWSFPLLLTFIGNLPHWVQNVHHPGISETQANSILPRSWNIQSIWNVWYCDELSVGYSLPPKLYEILGGCDLKYKWFWVDVTYPKNININGGSTNVQ